MSYLSRRARRPALLARRWRRRVAGAGLALTTALAGPAAADPFESATEVGVFVAFHFGGGDSGFGWGLEARHRLMNRDYYECSDATAAFGAGVARFELRGLSRPSLLVGAQGGAVFGEVHAANGEVSAAYEWGARSGLRFALGGEVATHMLQMRANYDLGRAEAAVAGGLRVPPIGCYYTVIEGRPLRDAAGRSTSSPLRLAGAAERSGSDLACVPAALREHALAAWSARARSEWASVPAFLQLAEQLEALDAPSALVARSIIAAQQEMDHAVMTAGVSASLAGAPVWADGDSLDLRAPTRGTDGLVRLAVESWIDGCLGEGTAAALAAAARGDVSHPLVGQSLAMVARDEASHAELAWDTLAWALEVEPTAVARALRAVRNASPDGGEDAASDPSAGSSKAVDARSLGVVEVDGQRAIAATVGTDARHRLDALLTRV